MRVVERLILPPVQLLVPAEGQKLRPAAFGDRQDQKSAAAEQQAVVVAQDSQQAAAVEEAAFCLLPAQG